MKLYLKLSSSWSQITADDFGAGVAGDKGTIPRQRGRGRTENNSAAVSISASKTCHGESAAVNRRVVSPESRSNSHLPWAIGARPAGTQRDRRRSPYLAMGSERPGQSRTTRLPGGNNDGLSAPATVRHCSLLRHDPGGIGGTNRDTRARRIEGPGADALPTRINHGPRASLTF